MKKVKVKIIKLAGETGLRLPGTFMQMDLKIAQKFEARGLVKLPEKRKKKDK